jgi:hypothetical protein
MCEHRTTRRPSSCHGAQIGYFGRNALPEPMGCVARTRIFDALDGTKGIVRVIPRTAAQN